MNETHLQRWEIEKLLPWHAAGTVKGSAAAGIDAALARDPELMRRYMLAREEMFATAEVNEALGQPSGRAAQRLFAAIDTESGGGALKIAETVRQFLSGLTAGQFVFSACAAAVLVLAVGVVTGTIISHRANNRVARTAVPPSVEATVGYAVVQFAQSAKIESISALLEANRATVIDGPSADGSYRVRIAALPNSETVYRGIDNGFSAQQQRDRAVANFRSATDLVRFAAPEQ